MTGIRKNALEVLSSPEWRKIWFTGDTHFGHKKILEITERPFESVEEHDETLIANWNNSVGADDLVIHLGDFAFKSAWDYRKRLNGELIVIKGNHDNLPETKFNVLRDYTGEIRGKAFHLYHYPILVWCASHYGSYHIHGHVHGILRYLPFRFLDAGVDCHDLAPIGLDAAVAFIDRKNTLEERYA